MLNFRTLINRWAHNGRYNVGFAKCTPSEMLDRKKLPKVHWMRHTYKDRMFADPFFLRVDTDGIHVLVEEMIFGQHGTINHLIIDSDSYVLKDNKIILKLDTHLSYPINYMENDKVLVYPENSASGILKLYEYDEKEDTLRPLKRLIGDPCVDSSQFIFKDDKYLLCTHALPSSTRNAYLYRYVNGTFIATQTEPVVKADICSRPGGNFFECQGRLYRPAQDCDGRYGRALRIMRIDSVEPWREAEVMKVEPRGWKHNQRLHTLNFDKTSGLAVIDGSGWDYPILGRIIGPAFVAFQRLKGNKEAL